MHRFYLPPEQCEGPTLVLAGPEAHHARHVLRVRRHDCVTVLDGAGRRFVCRVQGLERNTIALTVQQTHFHAPLPCRVTLLQAVPKGKLMEAIVQKATELGAARIVPLLTERVVARFDAREATRKAEKWRLVAKEAIKQCGSPWLPTVELPLTLNEFLARKEEFELPLVASLQSSNPPAHNHIREFDVRHRRLPASAGIWIGPEGDFTPAEYRAIEAAGFLPISLGPLILRVETATIYCLSILHYELQSADSERNPAVSA